MNALFAYILSSFMAKMLYIINWIDRTGETVTLKAWIYESFYTSWLPPKVASMAFALSNVLVVLAICWILYRRKIYIKV